MKNIQRAFNEYTNAMEINQLKLNLLGKVLRKRENIPSNIRLRAEILFSYYRAEEMGIYYDYRDEIWPV